MKKINPGQLWVIVEKGAIDAYLDGAFYLILSKSDDNYTHDSRCWDIVLFKTDGEKSTLSWHESQMRSDVLVIDCLHPSH